ncbi:hypothetical protein BJ742DRAFT_892631 [Cladochytrium replicatum]|nr:hypothetical protein BJ742DRAFT_892631 [Cladochytrium replicatum]
MVLNVNTKALIICDPGTWITNPINLAFPVLGRDFRKRDNRVLVFTTMRQAQKRVDKSLRPNECDFPARSRYFWLKLANDLSLQRRVRQEIESVVPNGADLTIEHFNRMPFMESLEVIHTQLPNMATRMTVSEIECEGVRVPNGSVVAFSHVTVHYSEGKLPRPVCVQAGRTAFLEAPRAER